MVFDFADPDALDDPGWLGVRRIPSDVASLTATPGRLTMAGDGSTLDSSQPTFIGRRQRHLTASVSTTVDATHGTGGLAARYAEDQHFEIEARGVGDGTVVTARAVVAGLVQSWERTLSAPDVDLRMEMTPPPTGFQSEALGGDRIRLVAAGGGEEVLLAELDGRYWTAETAASFTGRVLGLYAVEGTVTLLGLPLRGHRRRPPTSRSPSTCPTPRCSTTPGGWPSAAPRPRSPRSVTVG